MKSVSIRTLQHQMADVFALIAKGEEIQVTRHNKIIAQITPPITTKKRSASMPHFLERMRKEYPHKSIRDGLKDFLKNRHREEE